MKYTKSGQAVGLNRLERAEQAFDRTFKHAHTLMGRMLFLFIYFGLPLFFLIAPWFSGWPMNLISVAFILVLLAGWACSTQLTRGIALIIAWRLLGTIRGSRFCQAFWSSGCFRLFMQAFGLSGFMVLLGGIIIVSHRDLGYWLFGFGVVCWAIGRGIVIEGD